MPEVFVGLGSNIEPKRNLAAGIAALTRHFGRLRCSRVYRSPPLGVSGADFLNIVAGFSSALGPRDVSAVLAEVEHAAGRPKNDARAGPRTLDVDLLLYGARVDALERLPRGDVLQYPFVLAPLAELVAELCHPVTGEAIGAAWQRMAAASPTLTCVGALDDPA